MTKHHFGISSYTLCTFAIFKKSAPKILQKKKIKNSLCKLWIVKVQLSKFVISLAMRPSQLAEANWKRSPTDWGLNQRGFRPLITGLIHPPNFEYEIAVKIFSQTSVRVSYGFYWVKVVRYWDMSLSEEIWVISIGKSEWQTKQGFNY